MSHPATFNFHLLALKYIFRMLKDEAMLTAEVWKGIKPKMVITQSRRDLTVDELRKVVGLATGELKVLVRHRSLYGPPFRRLLHLALG